MRRDSDGVGERLDLVSLAEGGRFKDVGLLGGFGGEFFGFLGGFGDEIGDPGRGRSESLRLFGSFFGEGLGALPQVLHWSPGEERKKLKRKKNGDRGRTRLEDLFDGDTTTYGKRRGLNCMDLLFLYFFGIYSCVYFLNPNIFKFKFIYTV